MQKFHIDRLEKLYAFMGTVKPTKFYFGEWAVAESEETANINACGTTACAMGWAGSMPEFRKRGLKLVWEKDIGSGYVEFVDRNGYKLFGEHAGAKSVSYTHLTLPTICSV